MPKQKVVKVAGKISLPMAVTVVLVMLLAGRVGFGIHGFMQAQPAVETSAREIVGSQASQTGNLAALQNLELFSSGSSNMPRVSRQMAAEAEVSRLDIRLEGLMLSGNPAESMAIIVSNGRQSSFKPGDSLPLGERIILEEVLTDHVIISNRGELESVWLYEDKGSGTGTGIQSSSQIVTPAPANNFSITGNNGSGNQLLSDLKSQYQNDQGAVAATLAEIIQVAPAVTNGELVGYRLSPGVKLKEFVQLGLKVNDIVTEVNGIALTDMANLPRLYSLMNEATVVSFALVREGQPMQLEFTLSGTR